jgi:hypothetical protein
MRLVDFLKVNFEITIAHLGFGEVIVKRLLLRQLNMLMRSEQSPYLRRLTPSGLSPWLHIKSDPIATK